MKLTEKYIKDNYRIVEKRFSDGDVYFIPQRKCLFWWKSYMRSIGYQYDVEEMFTTFDEAKKFIIENIQYEENY